MWIDPPVLSARCRFNYAKWNVQKMTIHRNVTQFLFPNEHFWISVIKQTIINTHRCEINSNILIPRIYIRALPTAANDYIIKRIFFWTKTKKKKIELFQCDRWKERERVERETYLKIHDEIVAKRVQSKIREKGRNKRRVPSIAQLFARSVLL